MQAVDSTATQPAVDDQRSQLVHDGQLEFTLDLFQWLATERSLEASTRLSNGEYLEYLGDRVDPSRYDDPKHFAKDYLVSEILRKSPNLPIIGNLEGQARHKFLMAEQRNRETNDRLWGSPLPEWWGLFSRELLVILGPLTKERLAELPSRCKHGPGATVGVRGEGVVPSDKYDATPTATLAAIPFLTALWGPFVDSMKRGKAVVARGSRLFFVPKDATSMRSCAKEPTWNVFGQLGIGSLIADALKRFGVDLQDQEINQVGASLAQMNGDATIDLSQASDLLAKLMVYLALCHNKDPQGLRWWHLLSVFRCSEMNVAPEGEGAEWHSLEMMSSMGNGFTFALETALFLALARSVVPKELHNRICVYGDDIIVPAESAPELIDRLQFIGCKPNTSKTFLAGRFFESCGTDWFDGCNVRPFYLRTAVGNPVPWQVSAANNFRHWLVRVFGYCPASAKPLWDSLVAQVPSSWGHPVPPVLGDLGVHVAFSEREWKTPTQDHTYRDRGVKTVPGRTWEGVVVQHAAVASEKIDKRSFGVMAAALAVICTDNEGVNPRRRLPYESIQDYAWRCGGMQVFAPVCPGLPSNGLEPMRGFLRNVRTIKSIVPSWNDVLLWV